MTRRTQLLVLACAAVLALLALPAAAQEAPQEGGQIFLPLVEGAPLAPNRLGVDLRAHIGPDVIPYVEDLAPRWARAGDLLWSDIEPVRGAGYRWEAAAALEANIARIRAAGAEPLVIVQRSPDWAQQVPGRACNPPSPEALPDLARFVSAAAERYGGGPLQVHYWQLGNEVDFRPDQIPDALGSGCWGTSAAPHFGGDSYGAALKQVYPALKAANPRATLLAGGLAHFWPDDTQTRGFLRGMLAAGAGQSFDALSFSAYGMYQAADRLVYKTNSLRRGLAEFGLERKAMIAAEVGAVCYMNNQCDPLYPQYHANYAARIYAEAVALDLHGAMWYTLASADPGFQHSHLILDTFGQLTPRPAFYALRNSARLLREAVAAGPPPAELDESQAEEVQTLAFAKRGATLLVLWLPRTDAVRQHTLVVSPRARAACTSRLDQSVPQVDDCSDLDGNGRITLTVGGAPLYVEIR